MNVMESAGVQIGHFSDLHYGPKNLAEADRCFGAAVDAAIGRGIDVAVISGDATDHALPLHSPAVQALAAQVRRLAWHCPVLMLQGTFSHEPPGTLAVFGMLGGRYPVYVSERIAQVALNDAGTWHECEGWRFDEPPRHSRLLVTCIPSVNKASVAAVLGATQAGEGVGEQLQAVLEGFAGINRAACERGIATIGVSHGTVTGCMTEHGVPMAGFDHEFTSGALLAAQAEGFLLGHIHKHQAWAEGGRLVAYAGSIGRFHHGEVGEKGWLLWTVGAGATRIEQVATPARRTLDLVFEGKPDLARIEAAAAAGELDGASVRVRWAVAAEDRHEVDRAALARVLATAADVQMEARVIPVVRSRAEGISRARSLEEKLRKWSEVAGVKPDPLIERMSVLAHEDAARIAQRILEQTQPEPASGPADTQAAAAALDDSTPLTEVADSLF
ncbi:MAG TPA: metallophosphatase family protein [Burkholderiaceae bacterium]|nr:metallophosphatase family protein [Burkholderiaceae bacterium]